MEISFKRVSNPYSSKPPITYRTKGHEVYVTSSGPMSSEDSQEIVRSFFRENTAKKHNDKQQLALNTSQNDSMQGKKLSVVNIDRSQKGRVKIQVKALDVMA